MYKLVVFVVSVGLGFVMFEGQMLPRLDDFVDGDFESFKINAFGLYAQLVAHLKHGVGGRHYRYTVALYRADKQIARPQYVADGLVHCNRAVLDRGYVGVFFKMNVLFVEYVVEQFVVNGASTAHFVDHIAEGNAEHNGDEKSKLPSEFHNHNYCRERRFDYRREKSCHANHDDAVGIFGRHAPHD